MSRERDFGPDLVRAAAAALVIAVHFFLNSGFYAEPYAGGFMVFSAALRMLCMTCVPLFMVLSGWLCLGRRWGKGYLKGLLPVVFTWLVCGGLCLAFRALRGEEFAFPGVLLRFLDFTAAPYGWYVEMYLGLYLLMPFLNLAWAGLDGRGRTALAAALVFLCVLPNVTNLSFKLLPSFWLGMYPAAYYILGAWLRERKLTAPGWLLLLGWLGGAVAAAGLFLLRREGESFGWASYTDWASPFVFLETACLFALLIRRDGARTPKPVKALVRFVAGLSLPAYLLSYIFDSLFYPLLDSRFPAFRDKLPFFPLMAAAVLTCSVLLAWPVDFLVKRLSRLLR